MEHGDPYPKEPPFDLSHDPDNPLILSREELSSGAVALYAKTIKHRFPKAKIIYVVREQRDLVRTLFLWRYTNDFLLCSMPKFIEHLAFNKWGKQILHDEPLDHYLKLYDKENILVIPYELLRDDALQFYSDISEFCGFNKSYIVPAKKLHTTCKTRAALKAYMIFNLTARHLVFTPHRWLRSLDPSGRFTGSRKKLEKKLHRFSRKALGPAIERMFPGSEHLVVTSSDISHLLPKIAASNDRLQAHCRYDLGSFGYITAQTLPNHTGNN